MPSLHRLRSRVCLIGIAALGCLATGSLLAAGAGAASGGVATGGGQASKRLSDHFDQMYFDLRPGERRWANKTSWCESGHNPRAIGGGGLYRGAFMFLRTSWVNSPKSPGGDPIRYTYRTQAVVAVMLKRQMGTKPWPVCG